jgi:hypothetical protein
LPITGATGSVPRFLLAAALKGSQEDPRREVRPLSKEQRPEVLVDHVAYAYDVQPGGVLTVWGPAVTGERIVGRGLIAWDGTLRRIRESSDGMTEPLLFAIERKLNGLDARGPGD